MKTKPSAAVERLAPDECWDLLAQTNVGRLAVLVDGHPDIFPVNYVLDGDSIVFRTGAGTKDCYLRLTPNAVTGRRFKTTRPDLWGTPLNDARLADFH